MILDEGERERERPLCREYSASFIIGEDERERRRSRREEAGEAKREDREEAGEETREDEREEKGDHVCGGERSR